MRTDENTAIERRSGGCWPKYRFELSRRVFVEYSIHDDK